MNLPRLSDEELPALPFPRPVPFCRTKDTERLYSTEELQAAMRAAAEAQRLKDEQCLREQKPVAWLVCSKNADGSLSLEHAAAWEEAAHEHINDAITEDEIEGAAEWVVRDAYAAPLPASQGDGWVSFDNEEPPRSAALDDPTVSTYDLVLVTNNINARDRMGRMSHVWFAMPIKGRDGWVAFDDADREIMGLTHWKRALAAPATTKEAEG